MDESLDERKDASIEGRGGTRTSSRKGHDRSESKNKVRDHGRERKGCNPNRERSKSESERRQKCRETPTEKW